MASRQTQFLTPVPFFFLFLFSGYKPALTPRTNSQHVNNHPQRATSWIFLIFTKTTQTKCRGDSALLES